MSFRAGAALFRCHGFGRWLPELRRRLLVTGLQESASRRGQVATRVRSKVSQTDEGFAACVLDFTGRCGVRDEDFVGDVLAEANHGGRLQVRIAHAAASLNGNRTACTKILRSTLGTRLDRQFVCVEQSVDIDDSVSDPGIVVSVAGVRGFVKNRGNVVGLKQTFV